MTVQARTAALFLCALLVAECAVAAGSSVQEKHLAFYRERVPFDVYVEEVRDADTVGSDDEVSAPACYRIRIKTCNLTPEELSNIRFEVHVFLDDPHEERPGRLWQLPIMSAQRCEFKTVETPSFSVETLCASAHETEEAAAATNPAPSETTPGNSSSPPQMRFAVRLFVGETFVCQKTGIVEKTDEENKPLSTPSPPGTLPNSLR